MIFSRLRLQTGNAMADFREYMAREGRGVEIAPSELDALLDRYEWFSTGRIVRRYVTGKVDAVAGIVAAGRWVSSIAIEEVDVSALKGAAPLPEPTVDSADDIIEKFLQTGGHRIVADGGDDDWGDVKTEADLSDEDDIVSEELAEIYLSQGLKNEALEIYRKLSLLNTEKSVYFAEIIDKIENNN